MNRAPGPSTASRGNGDFL